MSMFMPARRAAVRCCAAVVACFLAGSAQPQVVISQVYGGGGNSGAPFKHDFIELFNQGITPVSLEGWSVQYAAVSGSSWQVTPLKGVIPPRQWYLVQEAAGPGDGAALPVPDAEGTIPLSSAGGKVALADTIAPQGCPPSGRLVDFLGWGNANCFVGAGPAPASSNTLAVVRRDSGMAHAGSNAVDFVARAPFPRNTVAVPLPVVVSRFSAQRTGSTCVHLEWTTESEVKNFGFAVQRRSGTDPFDDLPGVFIPGQGTTLVRHEYAVDDPAAAGELEYRLRQIDLDSTSHFSEAVHVGASTSMPSPARIPSAGLSVFPNPFNPSTTIEVEVPEDRSRVLLEVLDPLGRRVALLMEGICQAGRHEIRFHAGSYASGWYVVRVKIEGSVRGLVFARPLLLLR